MDNFLYGPGIVNQKLILIGNESELNQYYYPPLVFSQPHEIAMTLFTTYHTIPNVTAHNNCLQAGEDILHIPIGCYEIDGLAKEIKGVMAGDRRKMFWQKPTGPSPTKGPSFDLYADIIQSRCYMYSRDKDINFGEDNSLGPILGFEKKLYEAGEVHVSEQPTNMQPVNLVRVETNVTQSSYINGVKAHSIFTFTLNVAPGYRISIERDARAIYYPITTNELSLLSIRLVDQAGKLVDFRGEQIVIEFHVRPMK